MIRSHCGSGGLMALTALLALAAAGWGCGKGLAPASPAPQPPAAVPALPPNSAMAAIAAPPELHALSGPAPAWRPDPIFDGQLGFYQKVEGYEIRVPNGYEVAQIPVPPPPGGKVFSWAAAPRADGTRGLLGVMLVTPPPGEQANIGLGLIIETIRPPADQCSDWKQSPSEQGVIGGFYTLRTSCSGTFSTPVGKVSTRWSVYLCQDGSTYIFLFTADAESPERDSLRVANAAIMTFRKQGGAEPAGVGPPDDLPEWQPGEALVGELGPPQDIEEYRLRVPKGYGAVKGPPGRRPKRGSLPLPGRSARTRAGRCWS